MRQTGLVARLEAVCLEVLDFGDLPLLRFHVGEEAATIGSTKGVSVDPTGPASGRIKIEKGGWWGSNQFVARAAYRHYEDPPVYSDVHIGFRIVSP